MSKTRPRPMTAKEIDQYEKRMSAVHEAGHATVAVARGGRVCAWIYRNEPRGFDERTWLGTIQTVPRIVVRGDKATILRSRRAFDSAYAVAGMVAEVSHHEPDYEPWKILSDWQEGACSPSPSDLEGCAKDWRSRSLAVEKAVSIIREQKPLFDRIVAKLLKDEVISDGQMADLGEQLVQRQTPAKHLNKR